MPRPLGTEDFANIAALILEGSAAVPSDPACWDECASARLRSSVSRCYYCVILYWKFRLTHARTGWEYPEGGVHGLLLRAISNVLGSSHLLYGDLKALRRDRERADYELTEALTDGDALDSVDIARDMLVEIQDLDGATVRKIADELYDLTIARKR